MCRYFREFGPFIAIGKPGERYSTLGASREYVNQNEWKEVVSRYIDGARYVVLQPAKTEGIWWEMKTVFTRVPRQRILLCLSNFRGRQDDYDGFRVRLQAETGVALPRSIGNRDEILFSFFDAEGNPQAHSLSSLSPLVWPFRGQVADLRRTLVDFVEPAHQRMAPYLKKTYEGHSFPASVLTMLVIPLLLGVFGFLGSAMTLFIVQYGPWSNMRSQERSTGRYAATEPSFGMPVVPTSPMPRRPGSPMGVPNFAASDPMRKAVVGLPKVPGKGAGLTKARAATPPDVVRKPSPLEEVK